MNTLKGKLLVAQGGGPTAVINQSLAGVVLAAQKLPFVSAIYGALHGVRGIVDENFVDLTNLSTRHLELVGETPSSALLSTRDKPDEDYCARMFKVMQAHDIRYFFYIGGNDSSDTVRIVSEQARAANYDLRAIHIPKTIDNDLVENDHCPGFGSAAKFVTQAFSGAGLDTRALKGIYLGIIMGRHAGFLTASSALARQYDDDGPHLIYMPERSFETSDFLADVERVMSKHGHCTIAVSEGISDKDKIPMIAKLMQNEERDAHGNLQLSGTGALGDLLTETIKSGLNIKRVRADTFGYLQRCFLGCTSDRDAQEARKAGEMAVQFAAADHTSGSVVIRRPIANYAVNYDITPIEAVAGKTRHMPDPFINPSGNGVTEAFLDYCRPLLGSTMPTHHHLDLKPVQKIAEI